MKRANIRETPWCIFMSDLGAPVSDIDSKPDGTLVVHADWGNPVLFATEAEAWANNPAGGHVCEFLPLVVQASRWASHKGEKDPLRWS